MNDIVESQEPLRNTTPKEAPESLCPICSEPNVKSSIRHETDNILTSYYLCGAEHFWNTRWLISSAA